MNEVQRAKVQHMVEALEQVTLYLPVHTEWHFEAIAAGKALLEQQAPVQEPISPEEHLMKEAYKYWKHANAKHCGAVQWIQNNETGELLIYTRGEYRDTLMANIMTTIATTQGEDQ